MEQQDVHIEANEITDKVDRVIYAQEKLISKRKVFAEALVVGGNFEDYIKVLENPLNCDAVIARAYTSSEYLEKKA